MRFQTDVLGVFENRAGALDFIQRAGDGEKKFSRFQAPLILERFVSGKTNRH